MAEAGLTKLSQEALDRLNSWLYCHHCKRMHRTRVQGWDRWGRILFRCRCGGHIRILPA